MDITNGNTSPSSDTFSTLGLSSPELLSKLSLLIDHTGIAKYLADEMKHILSHMNGYRLENMYTNREFLLEYLSFVDKKNTLLIKNIFNTENAENIEKLWDSNGTEKYCSDTTFFSSVPFSTSALSSSETDFEKSGTEKCIDYLPFVAHTTAMKGYILLTVEEFCHATPTRIAINRLLLSKEKRKKSVYKK